MSSSAHLTKTLKKTPTLPKPILKHKHLKVRVYQEDELKAFEIIDEIKKFSIEKLNSIFPI